MQELEKILEEIEEAQNEYESQKAWCFVSGVERAANIIRKHMKNEENILKFYYCESEDDYYLGQRVQNMYYAKYGPGVFTWFMSRYLPWGTDGYPSEPKEIPFMEWIEGFIRKHMNDGWIPVDDEKLWDILFEEACVEGEQARRIYNRLKETFGRERSE